MFDCGEGAQGAFLRQGLKFSRLEHIFLTHLHGDHVFGLPGLIGTLALSNLGKPLTVHTFSEGASMLKDIIRYFNHELTFDLDFNIIEPEDGLVLDDNEFIVRSVRLEHKIPAVGYVVEEKEGLRHLDIKACEEAGVPVSYYKRLTQGDDYVDHAGNRINNDMLTLPPTPPRSYAHISDTRYLPYLAEKIRGVDLLFHETTYLRGESAQARERGHSTAYEAGIVARDAEAGMLLTGHYSSRYGDDNLFVEESKEVFSDVLCNYEGRITPIGAKNGLKSEE